MKHYNSLEEVKKKIYSLQVPSHWMIEENVEESTIDSKHLAYILCEHLFNKFGKLPNSIAPSKENAVYVSYKNKRATFCFEVFNDLTVVYNLNDDLQKQIILSSEFDGEMFLLMNSPRGSFYFENL